MATYTEKANLLVFGYLHELENSNLTPIIPNEIKQIILTYYLLRIESQMIFDKEATDGIEVINEHKIKMVSLNRYHNRYGLSAKLLYGISTNCDDYKGINSITWKMRHTVTEQFPNAYYFIGVVSNRTVDFQTNIFFCNNQKVLKDSLGISGSDHYVYKKLVRTKYSDRDGQYEGYKQGSWITVTYLIKESTLSFSYSSYADGKQKNYQIYLPTDVKDITHWYPAVGLRDIGDEFELSPDVIVQ